MTIQRPKQLAQQSPDYYQKQRQRHAEDGAPKRNHAPKTKENMSVVTNRWKQFCHHIGVTEYEHLEKAEKEDIMTFLDWTLVTFPKIRKRSTVLEYKRVFFMIYRKSMNCDFDWEVASEIHDMIISWATSRSRTHLTQQQMRSQF